MKETAIVTTSGGYKNAFTHGVLTFFEQNNFYASAYGACSSSAFVTSLATVKKLSNFPLSTWYEGYKISQQENNSQSDAAYHVIDMIYHLIKNEIFDKDKRFLVATSFVKNKDAALITQTEMSKRFGQKLLIDAVRKNTSWRDENLLLHLYDTHKCEQTYFIDENNIKDVMYATTRMLHAWHLPAYINGKPYVDGSYSSICPAIQMTELGYKKVICITTEHKSTSIDLFSNEIIPEGINDAKIFFVKPDYDLSEIGVDYFKLSESGLTKAFLHGKEKGYEFLKSYQLI